MPSLFVKLTPQNNQVQARLTRLLSRAMHLNSPLKISTLLGLVVLFPLVFPNPAITTIAVYVLIFAGAATGWNIFSGYTGYISLGYAAFAGFGAYMLAILCQVWKVPGGFLPFLLLPLVALITALYSLPLGWVALKTRHYTFLVITIAIFVVTTQLPDLLTGINPTLQEETLPIPLWNAVQFNAAFYYTALALLAISLGISWWIRSSKYGLLLRAIRDDEDRAQGLGVTAGPVKLSAFMISASFAGMAGAITAYFLGFVTPVSAFDRSLNIAIPLMAFAGGVGTLWGPIIGAVMIVILQQYLTLQFGLLGWDLILYGLLLIGVVRLLPRGMLPTIAERWILFNSARAATSEVEEEVFTYPAYAPIAVPVSLNTPLPVTVPTDLNTPLPPIVQAPSSSPGRMDDTPLPETTAPLPIPRRHMAAPALNRATLRARSQRLVTLPQGETVHQPGGGATPQHVGWPCSRCGEPLWAWGKTFFCVQCGLQYSPDRLQSRR